MECATGARSLGACVCVFQKHKIVILNSMLVAYFQINLSVIANQRMQAKEKRNGQAKSYRTSIVPTQRSSISNHVPEVQSSSNSKRSAGSSAALEGTSSKRPKASTSTTGCESNDNVAAGAMLASSSTSGRMRSLDDSLYCVKPDLSESVGNNLVRCYCYGKVKLCN